MMRSCFFAGPRCVRALALAAITFASLALADVKFTEPSAGENVTAGQIDVRWEDSGISPPISELTQYTLSLMVGGNDLDDMQPVATFESEGTYSTESSVRGTIPEGIAADIPNGFFFRMTSTKEAGGVLINYSNRFSISGLTGETALRIRQAAQALDGSPDGPPAVGNDATSKSASTTKTTSGATSTIASSKTISSTAASTTTHLTSAEASDTASTEPTEPPDADHSSSGLSKGATAGIAVAATILVVCICAAVASFMYIRHRRKQNEIQEIRPGSPFPPKPMSELSARELLASKTLWTYTTELSSENMVHEAGSGERPPELDHMAFRAELEGSQPVTPK